MSRMFGLPAALAAVVGVGVLLDAGSRTLAQDQAGHDQVALIQAPEDMPEGPGRDTVFYMCSACHSMQIVVQQGLSRERWDTVLDWMVEEQGMAELDQATRSEILDYLAEHYNEDRSG